MLSDYLALEKEHLRTKHYRNVSTLTKRRRIISIVGGLCSFCDSVPSYSVTYPFNGISKVERYCQSCYDRREDREKDGQESKSYLETDQEKINEMSFSSENY